MYEVSLSSWNYGSFSFSKTNPYFCNEKNKCYVTCNYSPSGNYKGQFASNVLQKIAIDQSYADFYEEAGKEFEDEDDNEDDDEDDEDAGMYLITNKILYIISFLILFI